MAGLACTAVVRFVGRWRGHAIRPTEMRGQMVYEQSLAAPIVKAGADLRRDILPKPQRQPVCVVCRQGYSEAWEVLMVCFRLSGAAVLTLLLVACSAAAPTIYIASPDGRTIATYTAAGVRTAPTITLPHQLGDMAVDGAGKIHVLVRLHSNHIHRSRRPDHPDHHRVKARGHRHRGRRGRQDLHRKRR